MSKVAAYLQEHIQGKVSTNTATLKAASTDGSILSILPEMVIYPRVTNDIRKITRFAWQLAEKGHVLPLTARGYGTDQTGAAIGEGAVIVLPTYMHRIFEFDSKQKLVRIQPGISLSTLNDALKLHGVAIPAFSAMAESTVGGAVANNARGPLSGRYGSAGDWVHQLEVVLASGDVLQTSRLSKRELNKKKGLQTLEGEVYRTIDSLIEDNRQLMDSKLTDDGMNNVGYSAITKVKHKDGSFDLTPLFTGSQGTLGVISEMIMKVDFVSVHKAVAVMTFTDAQAARDAIDQLTKLQPTFLEYFDSALFTIAAAQGKSYDFYNKSKLPVKAVVLVGFDDFNERANTRNLKKIPKLLPKEGMEIVTAEDEDADDLLAVRDVTSYLLTPSEKDLYAPALFDGAYVPQARFEEFAKALTALTAKHGIVLPLYRRELEGTIFTRPLLHLHKVGDKQKIFKLLDEYSQLITEYGGYLIAQDGEGRVKSRFAYAMLDDDIINLFAAIKHVFDPYGILNPGVKQTNELRQLVSHLRTDFDDISNVHRLSSY